MKTFLKWQSVSLAFAMIASLTFADEPKQPAPFTDWKKLVEILQQRYLQKETLTQQKLDEAFVKGLIDSLGANARILTKAQLEAKPKASVARADMIGEN